MSDDEQRPEMERWRPKVAISKNEPPKLSAGLHKCSGRIRREQVYETTAPERRGKAKRENWTPKQEEALAKAYIHCTLNKKKDNQQKADGFWKQVLNHFNQTVGGSNRTHHQVRSKWLAMQTKLSTFNGLYHQADRLRPSGSDGAFVMNQALKDYKSKEGYDFAIAAWEVVRTNQKWSPVPLLGEESSGSSQKGKSSVSGNYRADTPNAEVSSGIPDINEN
ncbi:putative glutathione transferase transcription factor MYB family [Helianthus annuus]|nr:putative glutathione transferase transcription factor MYB family [Helianthus annuus]